MAGNASTSDQQITCQPPRVRADGLARAALARGVVLAPGDVFSPAGNAAGYMRFNVAQMGDARIGTVLGELLAER